VSELHPAPELPAVDDDALDLLFQALASQPRRAILEVLRALPGCNVQHVAAHFSCSRIAVLKHLGVLEAANLVISRKHGRERCLWFNAVPLQQIHEMWTDQYDRYWSTGLLALKRRVEAAADQPLSEAAPAAASKSGASAQPQVDAVQSLSPQPTTTSNQEGDDGRAISAFRRN
jgi:DNA-binding transcriptional ArsR family regulator